MDKKLENLILSKSTSRKIKDAVNEWYVHPDYKKDYRVACDCHHKKISTYFLINKKNFNNRLFMCIDCIKDMNQEELKNQIMICDHTIHKTNIFKILNPCNSLQHEIELDYSADVLRETDREVLCLCSSHKYTPDVLLSFGDKRFSISQKCLKDINYMILYMKFKENEEKHNKLKQQEEMSRKNNEEKQQKEIELLERKLKEASIRMSAISKVSEMKVSPPKYKEVETEKKSYKKKPIPLTLKRKVWSKHIGESVGMAKCLCCKLTDIGQMTFTCGHIIAESRGGTLTLNNLLPICQSCNSSMGVKNMKDFIVEFGL